MRKHLKAHQTISRRRVIKSGAAALGAALSSSFLPRQVFAQSARKVKFTLPWLADGSNLYIYVSQNKGYWRKRGLDVEVSRGFGSVAACQAISTKKFDFGIAAAGTGIQLSCQGLSLALLGCVHYDSTMGICLLAESPIKTPKDLEGRKLGSTIASGEYPFLPAFAEISGFDLSKVEKVSLDAQVRQRALIEKQVDAISSFAGASVPSIAVQGLDTRFIAYKDYGLPFYGLSVVTRPEMPKNEPGLCEAVTEGVMEGVEFMLADPEAALAAFMQEVKEMRLTPNGAKQVEIGMGMFGLTVLSAEVKEHGLGWQSPGAMEKMTDLTMKYAVEGNAKRPSVDELYSNAYVGRIKLDAKVLETAQANYKKYQKYL